MAETKYGKYLIPANIKIFREGEYPSAEFNASPYGINVSWVVQSTTKILDEEVRKKLRENPHYHDHYQFITGWGSDPYNIGDYGAESWLALGQELEEHRIDRPSVFILPPGLIHGHGSKPGRVDKPVFHLDIMFSSEYQRTNLADPGEISGPLQDDIKEKNPGDTRYGKYIVPAELKVFHPGENLSLEFNAAPYGINVIWALMAITGVPDMEARKKMREVAHVHDFHQFVMFFGSNPYDVGEFDAEIPITLGEEKEEYIIDRPMVINLPPGLVHGMSLNPGRVGKPVYHLDFSFAPQYDRKDLEKWD